MTDLNPGDRVRFLSPAGLRLRGVIADTLNLKARGDELLVPVVRIINRKRTIIAAEHPVRQKIRWLPRSQVRKLPDASPESK